MEFAQPDLRLVSCTEDPLETLFAAWVQSRPTQYPDLFKWLKNRSEMYGEDYCSASVFTAADIKVAISEKLVTSEQVEEVFKSVTAMAIPVSESVHFTWGFTNLPIEWREQAVRKRQWGFWLTSMREFSMADFATEGRVAPPKAVKSPESMEVFFDALQTMEDAYKKLQSMGWTQEEARKVIPLSATHNGVMFSNYRALLDTLSARTCWVAQVDIWAPVIKDMVKALKKKHPLLGMIVSPPCFDRYSDKFKGCKYDLIQKNRLDGKDPYSVCPIYANYQGYLEEYKLAPGLTDATAIKEQNLEAYLSLIEDKDQAPTKNYSTDSKRLLPIWEDIWQRDPFTGKLK